MEFQTPAPAPYLEGKISVQVLDPDTGTTPYIIKFADSFEIKIDWSLNGKLANLIGPQGAKWHLTAVAHPLEAQNPVKLGDDDIPLTAEVAPVPALPREWTHTFPIAANTLAPGLYQLATYVIFDDGHGVSYGMAGFIEAPIIQIVP